jgi:hypothetical protein
MWRVLTGLLLALSSFAGWGLPRCEGWVIQTGLSVFEVEQKCGPPQSAEHRIEWRLQTVYQQQCQLVSAPVATPGPVVAPAGKGAAAVVIAPQVSQHVRPVCQTYPVSFTVPVEVDIWYFDDISVPQALHFENGRLFWVEPLWGLRHPN